jgi:transposase
MVITNKRGNRNINTGNKKEKLKNPIRQLIKTKKMANPEFSLIYAKIAITKRKITATAKKYGGDEGLLFNG